LLKYGTGTGISATRKSGLPSLTVLIDITGNGTRAGCHKTSFRGTGIPGTWPHNITTNTSFETLKKKERPHLIIDLIIIIIA
jgi:hypothetical protein